MALCLVFVLLPLLPISDISKAEILQFPLLLARFDEKSTDVFARGPLSFKLFVDALNISYAFPSIGASPQQLALNQVR